MENNEKVEKKFSIKKLYSEHKIPFITITAVVLALIITLACVLPIALSGNGADNGQNNDNTNIGGDNENTTTDKTYTVVFVDEDNNPIEGVKLVVTDGKSFPTVTSDKDGKASTQLPEGTISIMVTSVPKGYEKPEKVSGTYHGVFAKDKTELTITLKKEASDKVTYTVKVVDQNGDAVVGMGVQICPGGVCLADSFVTDENGEVSVEIAPKEYVSIQLKDLSGYTLPAPVDGSYHGTIGSGETEITITVTKN